MKYLLVLAVLLVAWHFWRSGRASGDTAAPPPPPRKLAPPEPMVHCAVCQVHVPQSDAVASRGKFYCSRQHAAADTSAP
ncbi:hypothetical protein GCM10027082_12210 [Comamonas humi]